MRHIRIICVGKTKERWLTEGLKIYEDRLRYFCKFSFCYVKEARGNFSPQDAIKYESENILRLLNGSRHLKVICEQEGATITSRNFALKFKDWGNHGKNNIDFITGGAYGLTSEIKNNGDFLLSLSKFTLTHQMVRIILLEQIYRSFTILEGQKYHH